MHLIGSPRQADRDHGNARQERIAFPWLERDGGEQVVLAEDHVGRLFARRHERFVDANDTRGVYSQSSKELLEMVAEIAMATDAQNLQRCSLSTLVIGGSAVPRMRGDSSTTDTRSKKQLVRRHETSGLGFSMRAFECSPLEHRSARSRGDQPY